VPTTESFRSVLAAARSAGAPWAYERLFREYAPLVAAFVRGRISVDIEDITSDVFAAVFERLATFDGSSERQFLAWIFTIARNKIVDVHRRDTSRPWAELYDVDIRDLPGGNTETEAVERLTTREVLELISALPQRQRDVVVLRILRDLSIAKVAEIMGTTEGAVKQLQHRATAELRRLLRDQEVLG
jgi:RNA polymerase sigma-70 factor (ECF subfamily)